MQQSNNCPLPDTCAIPQLLKQARYELKECKIDLQIDTISLKQIKNTDGNGEINYTYPLNQNDIAKIQNDKIRATIVSSQGIEEVEIVNYNSATGILKLYRNLLSPAINHNTTNSQSIFIDFGYISINYLNAIQESLCAVNSALCTTFPPYATTNSAGIGKASTINTANIGSVPTFVTTDDANWQAIVANNGGSNTNSTLSKIINLLNQKTSCSTDDETTTNYDVLVKTIISLACKGECFDNLLSALGCAVEPITVGSVTLGALIKKRIIQSDYGFKFNILHEIARVGAIDANNGTINPTNNNSGNILTEDFTSRSGGYVSELSYDTKDIIILTKGRLKIEGTLTTKWLDGLTVGIIEIRQGSTVVETLVTTLTDSNDIITSSIQKYSTALNPGGYNINFKCRFYLPANQSSVNKSNIYQYSHDVEFNPVI